MPAQRLKFDHFLRPNRTAFRRFPPKQRHYSLLVAGPSSSNGLCRPYKHIQELLPHVRWLSTAKQTKHTEVLVGLVEKRNFSGADAYMMKMMKLGKPIQPQQVFLDAVKDVLCRRCSTTQVSILAGWLALLPDAQDMVTKLVQKMLHIPLSSPQENLPFLIQIGHTLSSKGYSTIIENEILPVITRVADFSTLAHFASTLNDGHKQYRFRNSQKFEEIDAPEIFEEFSEDYSCVCESRANTSPAEVPLDEVLSIFEEPDEDYIIFSPSYSPKEVTSVESLAEFVKKGHYKSGYRLLKELRQLNADIPPSLVYESAAHAVLRSNISNPISTDIANEFLAWLSLIPSAHSNTPLHDFSTLHFLLFDAHQPDVRLIIRFATVLASKGYAHKLSVLVIPSIARFSSLKEIQQFLHEFNCKNYAYWMSHQRLAAFDKRRRTDANVRGLTIRALARIGRFDAALAVLSDTSKKDCKLTLNTYATLLYCLHQGSEVDKSLLKHIPLVLSHLRKLSENDNDLRPDALFSKPWHSRRSAPRMDFDNDLVSALKYIKSHSTSLEHPNMRTLVEFMEKYISIGRTRALTLLLNKTTRSNASSATFFIMAEMLFYYRRNQHPLVLKTFLDHFYLFSVPGEEIINWVRRLQSMGKTGDNEQGFITHRFHALHRRIPRRGKLFPNVEHCNLVWHALVALCPDQEAILRLYHKLLHHISFFPSASIDMSESRMVPILSSSAFIPFMKALKPFTKSAGGLRILDDMAKLRINPTVYHFTELAGQFAREGDTRRAMEMLDMMEASKVSPLNNVPPLSYLIINDLSSDVTKDIQDLTYSSLPSENVDALLVIPPPDLVTYISVLRGFIISRSLRAAVEVKRRLETYFPDALSMDDNLLEAFDDLHKLQNSQNTIRRY